MGLADCVFGSVLLSMVIVGGCSMKSCSDGHDERRQEASFQRAVINAGRPIVPVSSHEVVLVYCDRFMSDMNTHMFFGGTDSATKGNRSPISDIAEVAKKAYPETDKYVKVDWRKTLDDQFYTRLFVSKDEYTCYYRVVSK